MNKVKLSGYSIFLGIIITIGCFYIYLFKGAEFGFLVLVALFWIAEMIMLEIRKLQEKVKKLEEK